MTMRSNQAGSIRHHTARDLWEARYVGADGRRHSVYATTRKAAQERLRVALTGADHGVRPVGQRLTTGAYLDAWLTTSVRIRCRPSTADNYATIVRAYLAPALARVPLAKLGLEHVARMLADLTARGDLSSTTVRYAYSVLRIALGRALKQGKVLRNVCTLVDPPAPARHEISPLTAEQVGVFLAANADDRLGPLYTVAVGTGLRQGELLALRWQDVDLDGPTLAVAHTLTRGTRTLAEPKTERAKRTLRLGSEVLGALREQRRRQLAARLAAGSRWRDQGYVFTSGTGAPLDGAFVLRRFQAALEQARLPRQRFHDLRHATATLLLESGEELGVVSKVLGHSNIGTTANVYAHRTLAMSQRVAERLDAILTSR